MGEEAVAAGDNHFEGHGECAGYREEAVTAGDNHFEGHGACAGFREEAVAAGDFLFETRGEKAELVAPGATISRQPPTIKGEHDLGAGEEQDQG